MKRRRGFRPPVGLPGGAGNSTDAAGRESIHKFARGRSGARAADQPSARRGERVGRGRRSPGERPGGRGGPPVERVRSGAPGRVERRAGRIAARGARGGGSPARGPLTRPVAQPNGGGGGNRTRVRKPSTATSTCLAASWRGTAPESAFPFSPPRRIDPASRGVDAIPGVSPPARENRRLSPPRRRPFPPGRRDQEGRDGLSRQSQFSVVGLCVVSTVRERWTLGMQSLLPVPSSNPVRPLLFGEIFR